MRCPRCDSRIGMEDDKCKNCHFALRRNEGAASSSTASSAADRGWIPWKKGVSFFGLPRFLKEDHPDFSVPEAPLPKAGWKAVFAVLLAGGILFVYRVPMLDTWNSLVFGSGESGGSVSVEVLPTSSRSISPREAHIVRRPSSVPLPSPAPATAAPVKREARSSTNSDRFERSDLKGSYVITGKAYDLWTLEPVTDAVLIFHSVTGDRYFATNTVANGEFTTELPEAAVSEGLYLKVRLAGYLERAIERSEEQAGDLNKLPKEDRQDMGMEFRRTILPSQPLRLDGNRKKMVLFLIPDDER